MSVRFTAEVRRIFNTTAAFVVRGFRIRTQRARPARKCVSTRDDMVGFLAFFHPVLHGSEGIELVQCRTAAAMIHSGYEEQAGKLGCFFTARRWRP